MGSDAKDAPPEVMLKQKREKILGKVNHARTCPKRLNKQIPGNENPHGNLRGRRAWLTTKAVILRKTQTNFHEHRPRRNCRRSCVLEIVSKVAVPILI